MSDPIDFNRARVDRAKTTADIDPLSILREAVRRVESGEWPVSSVMVIGLEIDNYDNSDWIETMNGGLATTNERIGILHRAIQMFLTRGTG